MAAVRAALARADVPLEVLPGAELAHDDLPLLGDRELEAIAQGPPGRRWVLLEAPLFGGDVDGFLAATAEVRARGLGTLIAHPERCLPLMAAEGAIDGELRAGALLQVNGSSLTGRHGEAIRAAALGARPLRPRARDRLGRPPPDARPGAAAPRWPRSPPRASRARRSRRWWPPRPRALLEHGMAAPRAARAA